MLNDPVEILITGSLITVELEEKSSAASNKVANLEANIADPNATASERKKAHEGLAVARKEKEVAHHGREFVAVSSDYRMVVS